MRIDSLRTLRVSLAGTATSKFTDVMEAVFGVDEESAPVLEEEEVEEAEEDLPPEGVVEKGVEEEAVASTSKGTKRKATSSGPSSKRKQSKPAKAGVCLLKDATPCFHLILNYIFIPVYLQSTFLREKGASMSQMQFTSASIRKPSRLRVNDVPDCDTVCQQKAQVSSHIRQFHLGNCIACYLCDHRWWSATEWKKHMKDAHSTLSEDAWYVAEGNPSGRLVIKTEVTEKADV